MTVGGMGFIPERLLMMMMMMIGMTELLWLLGFLWSCQPVLDLSVLT